MAPPVELTSVDHLALNPVIHDVWTDAQSVSELLYREFVRPLEAGRRNPVPVADPLDHGERERFASWAAPAFLIEVRNDLWVGQMLRQPAYVLDGRSGIAHRVGDRLGQSHGGVGTGTALPTHM